MFMCNKPYISHKNENNKNALIILKLGNNSASLIVILLSSVVSLQSLIFNLPSDLNTSTIVIGNT